MSIHFRENLRRLRTEAGLTQRELAERCGVKSCVISFYETGYRTPNIEHLAGIAVALGCSIDALVFGGGVSHD